MRTLPEPTAKPCRECPWRRESAAGWLGPEEWVELAHSETPIACHLTVSEDGDWEQDGIRQCAGAAQYRKNVCMLPRNSEIAVADEPDRERVFGTPREFLAHHTREGAG